MPEHTHDPSKPVVRVQVKRCAENELLIVRFLSDSYGGLLTHYVRGRSQYCKGDDCPPIIHKAEITWKGYAPCMWWVDGQNVWRPIVLEITEHAELDLRAMIRKGQIWQFSRPVEPGKKNPPTFAALLEERTAQGLPPPFDVKPVLQTLYHAMTLDLSVKNPLPPRVFAYDTDDAPPEAMKDQIEAQRIRNEQLADAARKSQEKTKAAADRFRAKVGAPRA